MRFQRNVVDKPRRPLYPPHRPRPANGTVARSRPRSRAPRSYTRAAAPWNRAIGKPPCPPLNRSKATACLLLGRPTPQSHRRIPPGRDRRLPKGKEYEDALQHSLKAAALLGTPEADARAKVIDAMLAEMRRQFAGGPDATDAVLSLAASWRCNRPVRKCGSGRRCATIVAAKSIKRSPH